MITLGIVGVVAAMTIPTILTDISNKKLKTQFFKTYSELNQAARLFYVNEGDNFHNLDHVYADSTVSLRNLMKYFSGAQETKYKWREFDVNQKITQHNLDGNIMRNNPCDGASVVFMDASGRLWATGISTAAWEGGIPFGPKICVDTNGIAPPNRFGYDRFVFVATQNNDFVPYTGLTWSNLVPNVVVKTPEDEETISKYCSRTENTNVPAHTCAYFALKDKSPTGNGTYWKDFLKGK